jgi:hypothetical protein
MKVVKTKCPFCKKIKEDVGPKIVGKNKVRDKKLKILIDTLITKVMCNNCWKKLRK